MRSRIIGFLIFIVVAVGVAVGVYFASQLSDGTTAAQEGPQKPAATPGGVIQGMVGPSGTPTGPWEVPTCPPLTPTPTPPPPGESGPTTSGEAAPRPWPCIPADQPPPDKTPDLSSLFPEREPEEGGPEECEGCIDLGKPVPYEVPMKVAGKEIHLSVGSTHHMMFVDYPAGTGLLGPTELEIIERGGSKAVIDSQTGQIIEWDVAPEDEADFRRLILQPLHSIGAASTSNTPHSH
jgi:hypothetical protein